MYIDSVQEYSNAQSLSGTSDVVSTNVYDHKTAAKLHAGTAGGKVKIQVTVEGPAANADNTLRARYVGADNAALTTNPIILADTGVVALAETTTPANGTQKVFELYPGEQETAKQFYGVIYTQGGTSPTFTVSAAPVAAGQTNLVR